MQIDDKMLDKLEKLSAFKIPEGNREEFKSQLGNIVDFVEVLNELDLDNVEAAVSTISGGTPFREDTPVAGDVIDIILQNAPKKEDRYFEVPKIIE
ncbi:Glu-tRNA(Gln) amidotransferase, subunit C [Campylobacter iguaniorum]|uniref:Aspartyl/glutamyl-tRNA(Asn/Gln) amidotransferase subunit C n=1 Tax=Campylobacter iguaniorum TaxID=1244531 RepID=A0A076F9Z5_9BACT|nr:Asp-tRNA(Asn)/Glu-tRNA(Gln) amidotransferase subunit GatC [Campylobacter iguaniorum]AII15025.1 Glu-tRNA(Gln) amidotransferase, subunit C [Campylobacter iguaniorum]ALV24853.1 Glu-tRNA(Gln) amidotransferase, subunit C [Campylobacter iguaniorum]ANE36159.1 Glu-tRNA(Gln) amidotransferase, subunit C [Campylobacter iguaniorum]